MTIKIPIMALDVSGNWETGDDLRLIEASAQDHLVVGVYLTEVDDQSGAPAPVHFREAFRATGPSNYAHGKQEQH